MTVLIQAIAGALIAAILIAMLQKQSKDMAMLLSIAVCAMILVIAASYLRPVVELVNNLRDTAGIDDELVSVALKAVAVALLTQFTALICTDAGNSALAKTVELLGAAAILWLAIPLMNALLELIQKITGEL